jgi:hypothetical protein
MYDWTLLNSSKKYIIDDILTKWNNLLNKNEKELKYHEFLADNASFFFADEVSFAIISKLKLGSELETDFVVIRDGFSNGTIFEFIEIEKPWSKLFNKNGNPSKDFNSSLQQIRDWKRWLIENKSYFRKFLPTINTRVVDSTHLKFKIIIGRRDNLSINSDKRLQIANENNIEIRSFDWLTDLLMKRLFCSQSYLNDKQNYTPEVLNEIACPFNKALTDSAWKNICINNKVPHSHIYSQITDVLIDNIQKSSLYYDFIKK